MIASVKSRNPQTFIYSVVLLTMTVMFISLSGCGNQDLSDQSITGAGTTGIADSRSGTFEKDSTVIRLDLNISYKNESLSESKLLESNLGNRFNSIVTIFRYLKPGQELDLQELQPTGIFGLYLRSDGMFTLTNSDGLSFSSKSVLMEKCAFIDLKLRNDEQKTMLVTGFIAGE